MHNLNDERLREASRYLDHALDLPADELDAWLQQLQPRVAAEVRELMASRAAVDYATFLDGAAASYDPERAGLHHGAMIGSYRLLDEIGRGGMAVVYLAERADGIFEQRVALKVLHFHAGAAQAASRFAQERQILASLNHPSIARLIDGGITSGAMPYLVMEYVEGTPIDRHCDDWHMPISARLQLFTRVAEAVEYAHRYLVVHRDLKPSNILITRENEVKLLDFGIAKLLDPQAMPHAAPPTIDLRHLMTPEYASPEQARGGAVTTATDIYQLGVLLYELLTGRSPYELRARTPIEALRVICEAEPIRPSVAVLGNGSEEARAPSEAGAAARGMAPERLARLLRGDLEKIVLMALHKEPERRYNSVRELRDDVMRFLAGRPVAAQRATWTYRSTKFVRRHAAVLAVTAVGGLAFATTVGWYAIRLADERDRAAFEAQRAQREAQGAARVADFLVSLLHASDPRIAAPDITARQLLEQGAARVEIELAGEPHVQARMMNAIGRVYVDLELNDKAQPLLERALRQSRKFFGEDSSHVADSKQALATLAHNRGDFGRARRLYQEALAIREHTSGADDAATADTLTGLSVVMIHMGESADAIPILTRALRIYEQALSHDDQRALRAADALAGALRETGEYARARTHYEQLLPRIERRLGTLHPQFASTLGNLAILKRNLGDYADVEVMLRRAISINERLYGPDYGEIGIQLTALADLLNATGRFREAIGIYERAIAVHQRALNADHPFIADAYAGLGRGFHARGDYAAALPHYTTALEILRLSLGTAHPRYAVLQSAFGELRIDMGDLAEATAHLGAAVGVARLALPSRHRDLAHVLARHAVVLTRTGFADQAELEAREAIAIYDEVLPPDHPARAVAAGALGEAFLSQGRLAEAAPLLRASAMRLQSSLDHDRRNSLERLVRLAEAEHDAAAVARHRSELVAFELLARHQ